MSNGKLQIGISQCLLGDNVRYDGGHKRAVFLTDLLTPFVNWVPVCPEVEVGLGTPREAMHLAGTPTAPKLLTIHTKIDHTAKLRAFSHQRVHELGNCDLDGYIFKNNSPTCGIHRVKIFANLGQPSHYGTGIFSTAMQRAFPLLPMEEEGRLDNIAIRENFIERLFGFRRWKTLIRHHRISRRAIAQFHFQHKYVLLTHSHRHYDALENLVSKAGHYTPTELAKAYETLFMDALKVKATVKKHVHVLQQLAGHLKKDIGVIEWAELQDSIRDYQQQCLPLAVPLALMTQYVRALPVSHLLDQVYLNPHSKELVRGHHV